MRQETYVGVLEDSSVENHMIDPIDVSQCSYLSGEVLGSVSFQGGSQFPGAGQDRLGSSSGIQYIDASL